MRIVVAIAALILSCAAAQAATVSADVYLNAGPEADYAHDSRSGLSLDLGTARAGTSLPSGVTGAASASTGGFALSGSVARGGAGGFASAYSDARMSFYFQVDRPTDVTFSMAFSGGRTADGAISSATSSLRIETNVAGKNAWQRANFDRSGAESASFSDSIALTRGAQTGQTYFVEAYLASSIAGAFANGSHSLAALFGIGLDPGATLTVVDYKPSPVPLPATGLLLGAAIAGFGALRWRRRPRARAGDAAAT